MKVNFLIACVLSLLSIACSNISHPLFRDMANIDSIQTFDILQKNSIIRHEIKIPLDEFNASFDNDKFKIVAFDAEISLIGQKIRNDKNKFIFVISDSHIYCYSLEDHNVVDMLVLSQVGDPHLHQIAEFIDIDTILITEEHECQTNEVTYNVNNDGKFIKLNERIAEIKDCDDEYGP